MINTLEENVERIFESPLALALVRRALDEHDVSAFCALVRSITPNVIEV